MSLVRRFLAGTLLTAAVMGQVFCQGAIPVQATNATATNDAAKTEEQKKKEEAEKKKQEEIKRLQSIPIESNSIEGWPQGPATTGETAVVLDMTTGAVLYAKQKDVQQYPASITKILTADVALEHKALTDMITISQENLNSMESGATSIGLKAGEQITMEQGLYATMLASANEAAYAVAEGTTGSYQEFLNLMNEKAKSLGCKNSNFCNSNGLNDDNHLTTAYDMALIARDAYQKEEVRKIMQVKQYEIPATNLTQEVRTFQQHHKMLLPNNANYYEFATGGKTGYTSKAGNTLVTYAERDGMQLVAVVLKEMSTAHYADTKNLLEYGFHNFEHVCINDGEHCDKFDATSTEGACVTVPKGVKLSDLTETVEASGKKEDGAGTVTYEYKGQPVGRAKVNLSQSFIRETYGEEEKEKAVTTNPDETSTKKQADIPVWYYAVAGVWALITLVLIIVLIRMNVRSKKNRNNG